jgi:hypothetical protein
MHAGYLRLQTHTQNMKHLLIFYSKNGYPNAPQCYVYTFIACLVYNWRRDECVSWGDPRFSVILSCVVLKLETCSAAVTVKVLSNMKPT